VTEVISVAAWKAKDGLLRPELERARELDLDTGPPGAPALPPEGPYGLARAALDDALTRRPGDSSLLAISEELETAVTTPLPDPHWRAVLNEIAVRATSAGVVARGGVGLLADDMSQVRARAAQFLQVRGLAPIVQAAQLETYVR
jgi:hypothetical protein